MINHSFTIAVGKGYFVDIATTTPMPTTNGTTLTIIFPGGITLAISIDNTGE